MLAMEMDLLKATESGPNGGLSDTKDVTIWINWDEDEDEPSLDLQKLFCEDSKLPFRVTITI